MDCVCLPWFIIAGLKKYFDFYYDYEILVAVYSPLYKDRPVFQKILI